MIQIWAFFVIKTLLKTHFVLNAELGYNKEKYGKKKQGHHDKIKRQNQV